ncbi:MAG: hypothetical protein IT437_02760 [Phycisphaerales bacterium]|nr:hypothetical protein [Phycisphaerales bacterium]
MSRYIGIAAVSVCGAVAAGQGPDLSKFYVRQGYALSVVVPDAPGARFLEIDGKGTLYVSAMGAGTITAFRPAGEGYERVGEFVSGYSTVQGMQFVGGADEGGGGWLWFTTEDAVHKGCDADGDGKADEIVDVLTGLPKRGHNWRSLLVTPDGFYTSIGDSGNITDQVNTDRQKIWKYSLDGSSRELFISGIRNTEKLRIRPGTTEVWGFDHGSDWFGAKVGDKQNEQPVTDLNPPDELNLYVKDGFYGHPFIVGNRLPRYEYMDRPDIHDLAMRTTPPQWSVGAHWACNGWTFIRGVDPQAGGAGVRAGAMPPDLAGDIFVGCHGSWNSESRVGYCVARIMFDKDPKSDRFGRPIGLEKIIGTLDGTSVLERPVDCIQAPDGSVLFSGDGRGRVYRITWTGAK